MRFGVLLGCFLLCMPAGAIPLPPAFNLTDGAPVGPAKLTIHAWPSEARVGDVIVLNGTVTGIRTIAVYLYVTSPELDPRGVALENLNIAAGHGLFTTAPVKMSDGTWSYEWDTSIIAGNLNPGTYSVYVVASPLDRLRFNPQETAVAEISFAPAERPPAESPLPMMATVLSLAIAAILCATVARRT
ncbi:MAG: hypothetical protein CVV32_11165 [Methanomicrobiales archaeon HGW-Methanomicrobiales-3]|jgi:hypothetical protein|nr:MAG: hypothetical protein CVV32_11165 [Methanomicrobiales archaeon HGW-Methanomicrobiales-3]